MTFDKSLERTTLMGYRNGPARRLQFSSDVKKEDNEHQHTHAHSTANCSTPRQAFYGPNSVRWRLEVTLSPHPRDVIKPKHHLNRHPLRQFKPSHPRPSAAPASGPPSGAPPRPLFPAPPTGRMCGNGRVPTVGSVFPGSAAAQTARADVTGRCR